MALAQLRRLPAVGVFDEVEIRVLGCLIEKEATTPEYYPLTVNALVTAANQRTNRDPVTDYADGDIEAALSSLRDKEVVLAVSEAGARAVKYRHALKDRWELDLRHRAPLAVLMLRGDQTPGELRARTKRYRDYASTAEVDECLDNLIRRDPPLVAKLPRRPGEKEARFRHLLGPATVPETTPDPAPVPSAPGLEARVEQLERDVAALRSLIADLKS